MSHDLANCIDAPEKIEENEFGHKGDLFVVLASDRGLCGGFNNIIVREYRPIIQDAKKADGARIIVIGEKARAGLDRQFRSIFDQSFVETAKIKKMTFRQVSMCADAINDASFLTGHLVFTKFINSVSSAPTSVKFYPIDILMRNTELTSKFDNEGDDEVYKNLWEYMNATGLFFANAHSFASETASRMAAMTTSSQNAGEMGTKYKMQYNRTRQAKITAELSEIISGAAAAEDMV
jgi:ATP synthase F1 gamma subunit